MDLDELLARFKQVFGEMVEVMTKDEVAARFMQVYYETLDLTDAKTVQLMKEVIDEWESGKGNKKRSGQEKGVNPTTTENLQARLTGLMKLKNILGIGKVATFDGLQQDLLTIGLACNSPNWLQDAKSESISYLTLDSARHVLNKLAARLFDAESPTVLPSPSGGIYLIWFTKADSTFILYVKERSLVAIQSEVLFKHNNLYNDEWQLPVFEHVESITSKGTYILIESDKRS